MVEEPKKSYPDLLREAAARRTFDPLHREAQTAVRRAVETHQAKQTKNLEPSAVEPGSKAKSLPMDNVVVFVASELVAFPFCFAGAEALMKGDYRQGVFAYVIGLPFAVVGLSYPFWKRFVGERWKRWLFSASTLALPIGVIISFVYLMGPEVYRRANPPPPPKHSDAEIAMLWDTITKLVNERDRARAFGKSEADQIARMSRSPKASSIAMAPGGSSIEKTELASDLTVEDQQFRINLRKFVLSDIAELNQNFGYVLGVANDVTNNMRSYPQSDHAKMESLVNLFHSAIAPFFATYRPLEDAARAPLPTLKAESLAPKLKAYFDQYREAQVLLREFVQTTGASLDRDGRVARWQASDSRTLAAFHDLKSYPQAQALDAAINEGFFITRSGWLSSFGSQSK